MSTIQLAVLDSLRSTERKFTFDELLNCVDFELWQFSPVSLGRALQELVRAGLIIRQAINGQSKDVYFSA
jgi:Fe2+ or Zn2+ uptake regulation protein